MAKKRRKSRKSGFYRGFKKTTVPGDTGYVKPRKDGARYHKFSKSGPVHIDKYDPAKYPAEHIVVDYLGVKKPTKKRRRR